MPRGPRKKSEFGYYHLTARGIGGKIIFYDRSDYIRYLHLLKRCSGETNVRICAFCLMDNHIHLLVYDENDNLSKFVQLLNGGYAMYFNNKQKRPGYLFQGRFGSVPIESEVQLLRAFRYILNNPKDGGICPADQYEWSSYSRFGMPGSFVDSMVLAELIGGREELDAFLAKEDEAYEKDQRAFRHNDEWAMAVIREVTGDENVMALKGYDRDKRDEILRTLKMRGLSTRQIARLTGISRSVVQRA